jgi:hypothetical protein
MKTTRIISICLLLLAGLTLAAQQVIVFRRAPVDTGPAPGTGFSAIGAVCSANEVNSDTDIVCTTAAQLDDGNLGVVVVSVDNHCTTTGETNEVTGVADSGGTNVYTKRAEYCHPGNDGTPAANEGGTVAIFTVNATANLASSGTITATLANAKTAKAIVVREYGKDAAFNVSIPSSGYTVNSTSGTDPPNLTLSGLAGKERLYIYALACEGRDDDITACTNYTESAFQAGNGGSGGSSITGEFMERILTGTGDSCDPAKVNDTDCAYIYAAFEQVPE